MIRRSVLDVIECSPAVDGAQDEKLNGRGLSRRHHRPRCLLVVSRRRAVSSRRRLRCPKIELLTDVRFGCKCQPDLEEELSSSPKMPYVRRRVITRGLENVVKVAASTALGNVFPAKNQGPRAFSCNAKSHCAFEQAVAPRAEPQHRTHSGRVSTLPSRRSGLASTVCRDKFKRGPSPNETSVIDGMSRMHAKRAANASFLKSWCFLQEICPPQRPEGERWSISTNDHEEIQHVVALKESRGRGGLRLSLSISWTLVLEETWERGSRAVARLLVLGRRVCKRVLTRCWPRS